jgi:hypothetical protein
MSDSQSGIKLKVFLVVPDVHASQPEPKSKLTSHEGGADEPGHPEWQLAVAWRMNHQQALVRELQSVSSLSVQCAI